MENKCGFVGMLKLPFDRPMESMKSIKHVSKLW